MPQRLLLPIVLAVAALVAFVLLSSSDDGEAVSEQLQSVQFDSPDAAPAVATASDAAGMIRRQSIGAAGALQPGQSGTATHLATGEAEAWLEGLVLNPDLEPLADAWVIASEEGEPAYSDKDGRFRLPLRQPFDAQHRRWLFAWKQGYAAEDERARFGDPLRIILRPAPERPISVIDWDTGKPVPGATVTFSIRSDYRPSGSFYRTREFFEAPIPERRTDAAGLVQVPGGEDFTVTVEAEGYERTLRRLDDDDERIRVRSLSEQRFRLVRSDGASLGGAALAFVHTGETTTADDRGWFTLPEGEPRHLASMQVVLGNTHWIYPPRARRQRLEDVPNGSEVVVTHFNRRGKLLVGASGAADEYEVATTGVYEDREPRYLPDPFEEAELMKWSRVSEDGVFAVPAGWQSERSVLHVRRRSDRWIVHTEELLDGGPYTVSLAPQVPVTLEVRAEPLEFLTAAALRIDRDWDDNPGEPLSLAASGFVQIELAAGTHAVYLLHPDFEKEFRLGSFEVLDEPLNRVYELGLMRALRGQVTAGGFPVFPCDVDLYRNATQEGERGLRVRLQTDENGEWSAPLVPGNQLWVEIEPDSEWLEVAGDYRYAVPDDVRELAHDLPVAYLELIPGALADIDPGEIEFTRRGSTEGNRRGRPIRPDELPELRNGPVSLRVAPGTIEFEVDHPFVRLSTPPVTLAEGDRKSVILEAEPAGLVSLRFRDLDGQVRRNALRLRPIEVANGDAAAEQVETVDLLDIRNGMAEQYRVPPGLWQAEVRGPFQVDRRSGERIGKAGRWRQQIEVLPGRQTIVWLTMGPEGVPPTIETEIVEGLM